MNHHYGRIVAGGLQILIMTGVVFGGLSRGHQILLHRGLQIHADANVNDWSLWDQSNFTTYSYSALHPSRLWAKYAGYSTTRLYDDEITYMDVLVSVKFKDEQDLTNPDNVTDAQNFMQGFRNTYPYIDVLLYTNQWGNQINPTAMKQYMQQAQPDMVCFDNYPFSYIPPVGGSPALYYSEMQMYRQLGLAGNDGTGNTPIPSGLYFATFTNPNFYRIASDSELRLSQFAPWAFGYKFVKAFGYYSYSNVCSTLFEEDGTTPTEAFYQVAEASRQSRNLGPTLVRLQSTDIRILPGRESDSTPFISSFDGADNATLNAHKDWTQAWSQGTNPYAIISSNQYKFSVSGASDTSVIGHRADVAPGMVKLFNPGIGEGTRFQITIKQMYDAWTINSTNNAYFIQWLAPAAITSSPQGVSGEKLALWAVYNRNGTTSTSNSTITLNLYQVKTSGMGTLLWTTTLPHIDIETTATNNRDIQLAIDLRNRAGANVRAGYRLLSGNDGSVVQDWTYSGWFDLTAGASAFSTWWATGWDDLTQWYLEAGAPAGGGGTILVDDAYGGLSPIAWYWNNTPGYTQEQSNTTHFASTFDGGNWNPPFDNLSIHKDWTQAWSQNGAGAVLYHGFGEFWLSSQNADSFAGYRADFAQDSVMRLNPNSRDGLRFQVTLSSMKDLWTINTTENAYFVQYLAPYEISSPPQGVSGEKLAFWTIYNRNGTTSTDNSAMTLMFRKVKSTGTGTTLWSVTLPHIPIETTSHLQLAIELRNTFSNNARAGYQIVNNDTLPQGWYYSEWFDLTDDTTGEGFLPTWDTSWANQTRWYLEGGASIGRLGVILIDDAVVSPTYDAMPGGVPRWTEGIDPYITGIAATNQGCKNNGRKGDVLVGYFKPLIEADDGSGFTNEIYFMLVNGLTDPDLNEDVSSTHQRLRVDFDFGSSGITSLQRLSRETGLVETVSLVSDGESLYHLDLDLDGGTGDLFKFNTGAPWVAGGSFSGSTFTATSGTPVSSLVEWSDASIPPGTTRTIHSNTCKFYGNGTNWLYSSIRADECEGLAMQFDPISTAGRRFEHTVIRVDSTDPVYSSMHRIWLSPKPCTNTSVWSVHGERIILDMNWNRSNNDATLSLRFAVNDAVLTTNLGAMACVLTPKVDLDAGDQIRLALEVRDGGGSDVRFAYKKYTATSGIWSDWTTSGWYNPTDLTYAANTFNSDWKTRWDHNTYYYIETSCRTSYPTATWIDDVTVTSTLSGDANGDGVVDVGDLGILAANYGMTNGATWQQGDFNGDRAVDVGDLGILAANYGEGTNGSIDFNADYVKAFAATLETESEASDAFCLGLGLPLISGLLLMGLILVKMNE